MKHMMKAITFFALALVVLASVSCGGKAGTAKNPEGWIDDDTFRVFVVGYANEDPEQEWRGWQARAYRAAETVASETIMRKMVGSYLESTTATENNELISSIVREKASGDIVGQQVVATKYNEKDHSAELTMEMKSKGLKKIMDARIKQYFDELKTSGVRSQNTSTL